jgi:hypothetical protein
MKTFIHIGQHKTGTTSIQHYLVSKRAELAKEGLYVPDTLVGIENHSHFILNVYALNQNRMSSKKEKLLAKNGPKYFADLKGRLEKDIAQHYAAARKMGCNEIIWSNEGLYLLNSVEEYERLLELFRKHSTEVVCVCCFREVESYRESYMKQLTKRGIAFNSDKDSYRYVEPDSWLFDYESKEKLLRQVFGNVLFFPYNSQNMVGTFMEKIGHQAPDSDAFRLNVTKPAQ